MEPSAEARERRAERRVVALPSGVLTLDVESARWDLDRLCAFAVRANPRRGFLFVSRVLGKHLPVRPSTMRATFADIAAEMEGLALPSPLLCIGLAETATALGLGVFDALLSRGLDADALYVHTTRAHVPGAEVALRFAEPHSHAPDHVVYLPRAPGAAEIFARARTLVLVDDEISTGTTLANLAHAYHRHNPALERIVLVSLTDWSADPAALDARMPAPVRRVSLLRGRFDFRPSPTHRASLPASPAGAPMHAEVARSLGRLGVRAPPGEPSAELESVLARAPAGRILVLGTGEHMYAPYRLALALELRGRDVLFQSTTRSPILPGPSIASTLAFTDPTDGVTPSFVYNVARERYDHVFVCYETPVPAAPHELTTALDAIALHGEEESWQS